MRSSEHNHIPSQSKSQGGSPEPHPRDGHLRIPNKVADALARLRVSGSQAQILWTVLRKTLGWQKSGEWKNEPYPISLADFSQATGVSRRQLLRQLEDLTKRHILSRQMRKGKVPLLSLNLDFASWEVTKPSPVTKLALVTESALVTKLAPGSDRIGTSTGDKTGTSLVTELSPPPDTKSYLGKKPKETLNKHTKEIVASPTSDELKILDILRELTGWRYDQGEDLAWLRQFRIEFPELAVAHVHACTDYYSGLSPPKHKGIWKNRLRNWMAKEQEFDKGGEKHGGVTENRQRPKFDIEVIKSGEGESES